MSNCLCLACDRANSITTKFCTQCGANLQIQERYRALRVIGQGGFGKTFLAQDEGKPSQPPCVIKQFAFATINPNASQGTLDEAIRLFGEEAKRLDALGKHPQIPELLAFAIHEGKHYLVQEFVEGETLEQELKRVNAFSEQQVRDVLVEVLQILEFVHGKSVIHRDISPDNIIRRRSDKKLVLVDFGAAKHATATLLAKTGTSIGKPSYGAPEQMQGKAVFQSDLYGLGVTCLHLLTNIEPFTLYSVLESEFVWRQFLNGKVVSDKFGKLLDRLTSLKVKDRPSSAIDVLQELGIGQVTSPRNSNITTSQSLKTNQSVSTIPTKVAVPNNVALNKNKSQVSIELRSSVGIKYQELELLLKAEEWRKADELTNKLMCQICRLGWEKEARKERGSGWSESHKEFFENLQKGGYWQRWNDIAALPSEDLQTIDRLWVHYSNGKFGFSVQKKLWARCGGILQSGFSPNHEVLKRFAVKVGWCKSSFLSKTWQTYNEFMTETQNAQHALPVSLPLVWIGSGSLEGGNASRILTWFFVRAETCGL